MYITCHLFISSLIFTRQQAGDLAVDVVDAATAVVALDARNAVTIAAEDVVDAATANQCRFQSRLEPVSTTLVVSAVRSHQRKAIANGPVCGRAAVSARFLSLN